MSTTRKKVLKTVAGVLIFLFLLITIINLLGPLFRPEGQDFDGWQYFYAEDKNSLNAVMIGSSAIYRFYVPAQAYEEQGFTSCMISQSCQNIKAVPYIMEEAIKTQKVDLFVVETRQVVVDLVQDPKKAKEREEKENYYLSIVTSGMKQSPTRAKLIHELLIPDEENNELEWQIPLLKYHENIFEIPVNDWLERLRMGKSPCKGFRLRYTANAQEEPTKTTDARYATVSLPQESRDDIDKIVQTAEKYGTELLFVSTPYAYTQNRYNYECALDAYMKEMHYPFLNMGSAEVKKALDLDYKVDFYDYRHVNISGAEKVTSYLAEYLQTNYQFENRLNEKQKKEWDAAVEYWHKEEQEYLKDWEDECEKKS